MTADTTRRAALPAWAEPDETARYLARARPLVLGSGRELWLDADELTGLYGSAIAFISGIVSMPGISDPGQLSIEQTLCQAVHHRVCGDPMIRPGLHRIQEHQPGLWLLRFGDTEFMELLALAAWGSRIKDLRWLWPAYKRLHARLLMLPGAVEIVGNRVDCLIAT